MLKPIAFSVLAAVLLAGCGPGEDDYAVRQDTLPAEEEPVIADPQNLGEAIEKARTELDEFRRVATVGSSDVMRKARVLADTEDGTFPVWLDDVEFKDDQYQGVVEWAPSESQIPESTELTVPPSDVTDWIVVSEAGMAGGYTLDFVEELYADNGTENANESSGEGLPTNNETDAAEGLDSVEPSTLPLEG